MADDGRLGLKTRELIDDPSHDILISVVSLWEIVVKVRIGKLKVDFDQVLATVHQEGFSLLDVNASHLRTLAGLPFHHRDPFDHLLIAQAIEEQATFISEDRHTPSYPVQSITCSA